MRKDRQDVIRKIQRLLSLAQSSNQHEAELALAKAQALMLEHELSEDEVSATEDRGPKWVFAEAFKGTRRGPESTLVCQIVRQFFFCEVVYTRCSEADGEGYHRPVTILEIFGEERHAIVARYVFVFLTRTFKRLWKSRKQSCGLKTSSRRSYYYGLHESLSAKLRQQQRESVATGGSGSENAIMRLRSCVKQALHEQLPDLRKAPSSNKTIQLDAAGYVMGLQDGDGIQMRTPLGAQAAPVALING